MTVEQTRAASYGARAERDGIPADRPPAAFAESNTPHEAGWIDQYPVTSVLACFGLGLGLGVVLGTTLSQSAWPEEERSMVERFGRDALDALGRVLPERLAGRLAR